MFATFRFCPFGPCWSPTPPPPFCQKDKLFPKQFGPPPWLIVTCAKEIWQHTYLRVIILCATLASSPVSSPGAKVEFYWHAYQYRLDGTPLLCAYFEERFLWDNMGAFLLLVLLTWPAQQSQCKPTVTSSGEAPLKICPSVWWHVVWCQMNPPPINGYPDFCRNCNIFVKRRGEDYSPTILVEESPCCLFSEGCPTSLPLCSQIE